MSYAIKEKVTENTIPLVTHEELAGVQLRLFWTCSVLHEKSLVLFSSQKTMVKKKINWVWNNEFLNTLKGLKIPPNVQCLQKMLRRIQKRD